MTPEPATADVTPAEIRVREKGAILVLTYSRGDARTLSAEYLRVFSPSAEVQGHSAAEKRIVSGKIGVRIVDAVPVGNYAVRLVFGDGHDSGLFTWAYLLELADKQDANWRSYLRDLERGNLRREPPGGPATG